MLNSGGRSNRGTDIEIRFSISLSVPESSSIAPAPELSIGRIFTESFLNTPLRHTSAERLS